MTPYWIIGLYIVKYVTERDIFDSLVLIQLT